MSHTRAEVKGVYDQMSDEVLGELGDTARHTLDNFLTVMGDPKEYRNLSQLAHVIAQSSLIGAILDGHVSLTETGKATDQDIAERAVATATDHAFEEILKDIRQPRKPDPYL